MIIEYCQLLCTAWHMLDNEAAIGLLADSKIYKKTHYNHCCAVWTREHINNYNYVVDLALELCNEWRFRYNHPKSRMHGCEEKLKFLKENPPTSIKRHFIKKNAINPLCFTLPMPQAMPTEFKVIKTEENYSVSSCIRAYRTYYMTDPKKLTLKSWTKFDIQTQTRVNLDGPHWWKDKTK